MLVVSSEIIEVDSDPLKDSVVDEAVADPLLGKDSELDSEEGPEGTVDEIWVDTVATSVSELFVGVSDTGVVSLVVTVVEEALSSSKVEEVELKDGLVETETGVSTGLVGTDVDVGFTEELVSEDPEVGTLVSAMIEGLSFDTVVALFE